MISSHEKQDEVANLTASMTAEKEKILVIEDELNLLEGLRSILELERYEVLTAENGEEALALLSQQAVPPDLILSDIMMPKMSGLQLLQEVRKERRWLTVPFIFLTAKGERVDVRKAKELGVDDYIVKPYDPVDLLIIVKSRLDRHRDIGKVYHENMDGMKRDILTILNHEFRTPLTFVIAYADMLNQFVADQLTEEELKSFLHGVSSGANRLRRLIENFMLLVEMETNEAEQTYNWRKRPITELEPLLYAARDEALKREAFEGYTCEIEVEADLPTFTGDEEYLRRALVQLVDNAAKFSTPDKPIVMRAATDGDKIRISVTDQGRGIPPEEKAHILTSFYQINRAAYEDQGAGAGLAIVKGVVGLHGGKLQIESAPGEGSTFSLLIPVT